MEGQPAVDGHTRGRKHDQMDRHHGVQVGPGNIICAFTGGVLASGPSAERTATDAHCTAARAQRASTRAAEPAELVRRLLELKRRQLSITALGHSHNCPRALSSARPLPIQQSRVYCARRGGGDVEEQWPVDGHTRGRKHDQMDRHHGVQVGPGNIVYYTGGVLASAPSAERTATDAHCTATRARRASNRPQRASPRTT